MKKLLVLSLVVGMASLASAALSLSVAGDTVAVVSDNDQAYGAWLVYSAGLPGTVALTAGGDLDLSFLDDYGVNDGADLGFAELGSVQVYNFSVGSAIVGAIEPGTHLTAQFAGFQFGDVDMGLGHVNLLDNDLTTVVASAYVVPEPATMVLLGLGALVLRKRK